MEKNRMVGDNEEQENSEKIEACKDDESTWIKLFEHSLFISMIKGIPLNIDRLASFYKNGNSSLIEIQTEL